MNVLKSIFGRKAARIEKTEQLLAVIANSMQNLDGRKLKALSAHYARSAFLAIARDYGKNDNDHELAEGVMRLVACYSNCFGLVAGFELTMDIGEASGGTHLGMSMFDASLSTFTSLNTVMSNVKENSSPAERQTPTTRPVIERTRMPVSEINSFCRQNRYFLS